VILQDKGRDKPDESADKVPQTTKDKRGKDQAGRVCGPAAAHPDQHPHGHDGQTEKDPFHGQFGQFPSHSLLHLGWGHTFPGDGVFHLQWERTGIIGARGWVAFKG